MSPSREFPYQDGDVTVLGPEIFASKGGAVISWRGENYIRQQDSEAPRDVTADAVYELASSVRDLTSAIRLETADREQQPDTDTQISVHVDSHEIRAAVEADVEQHLRYVRTQQSGGTQ